MNWARLGLPHAPEAEIRRKPRRGRIGGIAQGESAHEIDDDVILSHVNATAAKFGGKPGMALRDFVKTLIEA